MSSWLRRSIVRLADPQKWKRETHRKAAMENTDEAEALEDPTSPEEDTEEKPGEEAQRHGNPHRQGIVG